MEKLSSTKATSTTEYTNQNKQNTMNREIKFRGKCAKSGDWVYGDLIHGVGLKDGCVFILPCRVNLAYVKHCDPLDGVMVNPETVGQYTGLKDKDGKEIYEGDQLYICAGYSCVVEFQDGMFVGVYSHFEDGEIVPLHEHNTTKCQIIHDNPELINS